MKMDVESGVVSTVKERRGLLTPTKTGVRPWSGQTLTLNLALQSCMTSVV